MAASQLGHGNEVEPVSSRGMPDDVQFTARSVMISPQEQMAHALPFFMLVCRITSGEAIELQMCWLLDEMCIFIDSG
ncbi:hypothetical protein N9M86_03700 [Euryarchaeota archaeon]|nr:hypothetical protein [Euryarchaeota archaeon]MDA9829379.1 hypothetical protein [Candidatus Poseidoniaceae archaeon]MDC0655944.1 hypothetical protein [Candidatus Poseidoniaceae archaeon]